MLDEECKKIILHYEGILQSKRTDIGVRFLFNELRQIISGYEKTIINRCTFTKYGMCVNEWMTGCHEKEGYKNFKIPYSQILGDKLKILKELSDESLGINFDSKFQVRKNYYCDKYEDFRNIPKGSSNCRNWGYKRFAREVFNLNFTRNNYNLVVDYTNKLKEANYCGEIDEEIIDHANHGYGLFLDDMVSECSDDNCKVTNLHHEGCNIFGNINGVMTCLNKNDEDDKNNDENKTPCQKLQEQIPDGKNEIIISANQEAGTSGLEQPLYYLVISKDKGCYYKNRDCKELENKQCNPSSQDDLNLDSMGFEHRPSLITQTCNDNGTRKNLCCVTLNVKVKNNKDEIKENEVSRFISVPQGLSCDATCDKENTDVACGEKYSCIDANEGVIELTRECNSRCKNLQAKTSCGESFNCDGTILYGTKNCKKNEFCDNKLNNVKCGTPVKCYKNSGELVEEIGKRGCGACEDAAYIQCGQQFYCKMADGSYRYASGSKGCKMCIDETENIQCGEAINCISDYGMTVEDYGTKGCPPCAASEAWRDNHGCVDEFGKYKDKSHWYDGIKQ